MFKFIPGIKIAVIPAAMRGGVIMLNTIQHFFIVLCSMMKIRMTARKVELMWTEKVPKSIIRF